MIKIVLREHEALCSDEASERRKKRADYRVLPAPLFERLRRFDTSQARLKAREAARRGHNTSGHTVLEWDEDQADATQWVGVIQVPGAQVEIVPKIDAPAGEDAIGQARHSLLMMLSYAGELPVRPRDVAALHTERATLTELLLNLFAREVVEALSRGVPRGYIRREDDLNVLRGRLNIPRQLRRHAANPERLACRFDELHHDIPLNRALVAACHLARDLTRRDTTRRDLNRCLAALDGVTPQRLTPALVDAARLDRQTARFATALTFCRLLATGESTGPASGATDGFSLCFDMNALYERFIEGFIRQEVLPCDDALAGLHLTSQGGTTTRHLLRNERTRRPRLQLKPDLVIYPSDEASAAAHLVLDTKWKRLHFRTPQHDPIAREDLYQVTAYQRVYATPTVALLYPHHDDLNLPEDTQQDGYRYHINQHNPGDPTAHIHVCFTPVRIHDSAQRDALADRLSTLIRDTLGLASAEDADLERDDASGDDFQEVPMTEALERLIGGEGWHNDPRAWGPRFVSDELGDGRVATGFLSQGGTFIIEAGSPVLTHAATTSGKWMDDHVQAGNIAQDSTGAYHAARDVLCPSFSGAGRLLVGNRSRGNHLWHVPNTDLTPSQFLRAWSQHQLDRFQAIFSLPDPIRITTSNKTQSARIARTWRVRLNGEAREFKLIFAEHAFVATFIMPINIYAFLRRDHDVLLPLLTRRVNSNTKYFNIPFQRWEEALPILPQCMSLPV